MAQPFIETWTLIRRNNAENALTALAKAGADPNVVLGLLENLRFYSLHPELFESPLAGRSRKEVKADLAKVRGAYASLLRLLPLMNVEPISPSLEEEFFDLPNTLDQFARTVDRVLRNDTPKQRPDLNHLLANLVCYVKQVTKKYRDEQVSALVSAVMNRESYDAPALKQWRHRNKPC